MEWQNLALGFYFPADRRIHYIGIKACLESFTNPQIANIISYIRRVIEKKPDQFPDLKIPKFLKESADLIGAALSHQQLAGMGDLPLNHRYEGWIY